MHLFFLFLLISSVPLFASSKPNIVIILADDLGLGDVACYGKERGKIETPNIDALAAGGLKFTDAHVNASVCGPTRRALMTGRYPWRFGNAYNNGPWGFCGPKHNTEKYTLGKMLKRSGYKTGYVGKWHLGTIMATKDGKTQGPENVDFSEPLSYGAPQFGFDVSFILPGSLDMFPYAFIRNNIWQGEITAQKGWSAFNRVGPAEKNFEDHKTLETFYTEAETFIANQNPSNPFFLFLALTAPHTPTSPGLDWRGKSKLGVYGDLVMHADHSVERVIKALKKKGVYQNTLILFTSDHGAAAYAGNTLKATPAQIKELEKQGHYSNGIYRGYKFSVYEGGLRVPFIAHWPAVIQAGQECHALVGLNDVMATFADITNTSLSNDEAPDSISFKHLLSNPNDKGKRKNLVLGSVKAKVIRDGDWKLCLCPGSGIHTGAEQSVGKGNDPLPSLAWKKALDKFGTLPKETDLLKPPFVQLFNLKNDPHEDHNLASKYPELVEKMVKTLELQVKRGRSTPGPDLKNDQPVKLVHLHDRGHPKVLKDLLK